MFVLLLDFFRLCLDIQGKKRLWVGFFEDSRSFCTWLLLLLAVSMSFFQARLKLKVAGGHFAIP